MEETTLSDAERFVIQLYSPASSETAINALRVAMFMKKNPEALPPTKNALDLHIKRAHIQASVWLSATDPKPNHLLPQEFGWKKDSAGQLQPQWTTQDPLPKTCSELKTCNCKSQCRGNRCTCARNKVGCIGTCGCYGDACNNIFNEHMNSEDEDDDSE